MRALFEGAVKFREEDFKEHRELFESLEHKQEPHTLFVGCADSRVVPNLITNTLPGELFVVRNIANVVPPYRKAEEFLATTSAVEYALNVLNVRNVIICGHSNCGGCSALYLEESKLHKTPHVKKWLELLEPAKRKVLALEPDTLTKRLWMTEQFNIEKQLENLFTYPRVSERYEAGELSVYGWYYIIATGEVFSYDFNRHEFMLVKEEER
ncbi:MAG: carbonic anhydrase [Wolinella sp.]